MIMQNFRRAAALLCMFTVVLGLAYPLAVSGVAHMLFPAQADGSLLRDNGRVVGSLLIGQAFSSPQYFWGRPSATAPQPYNGVASGGSNLGPLNPALLDQVNANIRALRDADPGNARPIPVDLVSASASGLDPEMSIAAAVYQAGRVARARGIAVTRVEALIRAHRSGALLGYIGEPRVNVLELNLALDHLSHSER